MCDSNLEEVFGDDSESLRMITDALEVGVLIQDSVVCVQEKVKRVLVQEVHLKKYGICLLIKWIFCRFRDSIHADYGLQVIKE